MKIRTLAASVVLALAAAGCTDRATDPLGVAPGPPRLDNRLSSVSIKDPAYAALATNGDWTAAIRAAVAAARVVYFPADSYAVSDSIRLPAGTRLYGDGAGSLIHQKVNRPLFKATGSSSAFVDSLTVDHLRFRGTSGYFALDFRTVRHVTVTDNVANVIGLIHVSTHLPINVNDGTPDPAATAGLTSESQLSRWITILRNRATGTYVVGSHPNSIPFGIYIEYAADGTISHNVVRNYQHGIEWLGGDANPARGGALENPRWLRRFVIQYDSVFNTEGGIWGGMAEDVTVSHNYVETCADVCLDAEGSTRVTFSHNVAKDAGGAVLAAFYYSRDVTFEHNDVRSAGVPGQPERMLFRLQNGTEKTDSILVTVRNNTFTWTGTGVGEIVKESSRMLVLEGNTVTNAVLKLDPGNNGGGVRVLRNRITFDRSTGGQPAIRLGHNYACWEAYPLGCKVEVRGNHISTGVAQDTAKGILYWAKGPAVDSTVRIVSDTVVGFGRWLKIYGDAATQVAFTVTNNVYAGVTSGAIELGGVVVPTITQSGNMPLPAMTATISGPFRVPAWETRLWVAGSNHGAAPLSYQWYVNNVLQPGATSQEFEYTAGSTDFTVRVVVTDAHLRSASATKPVTVCTDCDA